MKKKVCVIVPGYNEEKVIEKSILALTEIFPQEDIYMVDDGSIDNTGVLAQILLPNVLILNKNSGKAAATNSVITRFNLAERYEFIVLMDSDTVISHNFLKHILPIFEKDINGEIAVVMGRVRSRKYNWITSYRIWEYEVAQTIHKSAQHKTNTIIVSPGCSSVYRSDIFKKLIVPQGTLAEDMDLTYTIHRQKLGKIVFEGKAKVTTQDPRTLKDFVKQIDRWYTGFWQCVVKHHIPWGGQRLDLEVSVLALEGLFNGLLIVSLFILTPLALFRFPKILMIPFFLDFFLFLLPTIIFVLVKHKNWKIFFYLPGFYLIRAISSLVFLKSFFKIILNFDANMSWYKAYRYRVN